MSAPANTAKEILLEQRQTIEKERAKKVWTALLASGLQFSATLCNAAAIAIYLRRPHVWLNYGHAFFATGTTGLFLWESWLARAREQVIDYQTLLESVKVDIKTVKGKELPDPVQFAKERATFFIKSRSTIEKKKGFFF